jgi:4'-phosphopantetheinyl transferase
MADTARVSTDWLPPPETPALAQGEVHLWRFDAGESPEAGAHAELLTPDERERAARFLDEPIRRRYVAGRALLRRILGRYSRRAPETLRFQYGGHGKPALPEDLAWLCFNMSDSCGMLLYAVARERRLGVDVERFRAQVQSERLARRYFAPSEAAALAATPPERRHETFFTVWTRKEAYVKAIGTGLSFPLKDFEVTVPADAAPPRLLTIKGSGEEAARWTLLPVDPAAGYAASLVVEGPPPALRFWDAAPLWTHPC